ncbi:MAG: Crp/Fnr family transcriptional regulator [Alphaproteobacteria bacterium]|nr:MAG: Crp/Fnr family transcriptional regulator [Alphaproteobacteria bacterium]
MPHSNNRLFARLGVGYIDRLKSYLTVTQLHQGEVLADVHQCVNKVYFPHGGIISCVVELKNGEGIETGMIGADGVFGAMQALDDKVSLNRVIVQVSGVASIIEVERLREVLGAVPDLRALLVKYEQFFLAQVQQTAACNAVHDIHARMCRWLLRMHDLVGTDLPLTQEFLAQMMGVRRTSVTEVAGELQRAGLVTYSRGHVHIEAVARIRERACECHETLQLHYDRLFQRAV